MLEVLITIKAPELTDAIKSLVGVIYPMSPASDPGLLQRQATQMQLSEVAAFRQAPQPVPVAPVAPVVPMAPAAPVAHAAPVAPVAPVAQAPAPMIQPPAAVPTAAPEYTHEQIGRAVAAWIDKAPGNREKALSALNTLGSQSITQLDTPAKRGAYVNALRILGVQI